MLNDAAKAMAPLKQYLIEAKALVQKFKIAEKERKEKMKKGIH